METYYKDKHVLILGGLGYVGPKLAKRLSDLGAKVTIVARNAQQSSDKHAKYPELYEATNVVSLDPLVDFESLKYHLDISDIVLNLIHEKKHNLEYQQDIVTFNFNLLHYCQKKKLNPILVHFGSRLEYAKDCTLPIKENSILKPTGVYGFGKLMSENYYQFFNQNYGLRTICFRVSNVYGSVDKVPFKNVLVDTLIFSALHEKIKIDHNPDRYKDFIYLDDFIDVILLSVKNEQCYGKIFNISGGQKISLRELAEKIRKIFNPKKEVVIIDRWNDDPSFFLDISAIKEANNWEPKINIDDGLQKIKNGLDVKIDKNRT